MKPATLTVKAELAGAVKSYNALVQQENIQDVITNSDYLDGNRDSIVMEFFALCTLDCSREIFKAVEEMVHGQAEATN